MATATFEQELLNAPTYDYRRAEAPRSEPSFSELLGILNYNQGLVEFADSKAGSLILLNSLLIAAVGALPSSGSLGTFKLASVVLCSAAVYICFQVISSKDDSGKDPKFAKARKSSEDWEKNDFLFFGCIGKHKSGDEFCRAFGQSDDNGRRRAVLQRTYVISKIAKRKFSQYKTAQQMTSVALVVWVAVNLIPFLTA
jgi:hypothetical protein